MMKLTEISQRNGAEDGVRNTHGAVPAQRGAQADPEREALMAAIKSAKLYAAVVVKLEVAEEPLEALMTFADLIRGLHLPDSFAGYAIIGPDNAGSGSTDRASNVLVCRILFKAVGSTNAVSIDHLCSNSPAIEVCDCFVDVQEQFVRHIAEFCDDAICIAAVGGGTGGMIPLWLPIISFPKLNV